MKCEGLVDYFNGTLTEKEAKAFEQHLAECPDCQEEWDELKMLTEDLPFAAEPAEPNEGMKDRVLSAVFAAETEQSLQEQKELPVSFQQPKSRGNRRWIQPLLAASLLLSAGVNLYFVAQGDPGQIATENPAQLARNVALAPAEGFSGAAQASMVQENGHSSLILQAEQLAVPAGSEAYQVWLINEAGEKVRAGTFDTNENGSGAVSYTMPEEGEWQMIAVTLEPTPDSEQPLGDIVLAAEL